MLILNPIDIDSSTYGFGQQEVVIFWLDTQVFENGV